MQFIPSAGALNWCFYWSYTCFDPLPEYRIIEPSIAGRHKGHFENKKLKGVVYIQSLYIYLQVNWILESKWPSPPSSINFDFFFFLKAILKVPILQCLLEKTWNKNNFKPGNRNKNRNGHPGKSRKLSVVNSALHSKILFWLPIQNIKSCCIWKTWLFH